MERIQKDRHPSRKSDNNVEVSPAQLPNASNDELTAYLCNSIDPLQESSSFGIDIYAETLTIIVQRLEEYNL